MEEHADQLYLLESLINAVAHEDGSLLDLHVLDALEATRRTFVADVDGRTFQPPRMDPRVHFLFVGLRGVGNLLVGRAAPELETKLREPIAPVSLEIRIKVLRRLEKSVKIWSEQGGRQGYLQYIAEFLPPATGLLDP